MMKRRLGWMLLILVLAGSLCGFSGQTSSRMALASSSGKDYRIAQKLGSFALTHCGFSNGLLRLVRDVMTPYDSKYLGKIVDNTKSYQPELPKPMENAPSEWFRVYTQEELQGQK